MKMDDLMNELTDKFDKLMEDKTHEINELDGSDVHLNMKVARRVGQTRRLFLYKCGRTSCMTYQDEMDEVGGRD